MSTPTSICLESDHPLNREGSYRVEPEPLDEAAARRFLASALERLDTHQRISAAVAQYEARVAADRPYEDTIDSEEFRARYGI